MMAGEPAPKKRNYGLKPELSRSSCREIGGLPQTRGRYTAVLGMARSVPGRESISLRFGSGGGLQQR